MTVDVWSNKKKTRFLKKEFDYIFGISYFEIIGTGGDYHNKTTLSQRYTSTYNRDDEKSNCDHLVYKEESKNTRNLIGVEHERTRYLRYPGFRDNGGIDKTRIS